MRLFQTTGSISRPYRVLHFTIVALFATRLIPTPWRSLTWPILRPLIVCGEQSLSVFCVGVFLSLAGHFVLVTGYGSIVQQILVSLAGSTIMTLVANYVSWSKRQDRQPLAPMDGRTIAEALARQPPAQAAFSSVAA